MANIAAVICELNPLHRGHEYIFKKAREHGGTVVAIMSGNFVQRGECAVFHKYARAEAALAAGADLVLELPFPWSAAPAQFFAVGGMSLAAKIGADVVVFGSECGDIEKLKRCAGISGSGAFLDETEKQYGESVGYAAARQRAAEKLCPELAEIFSSSNDMLALEYIKNAEKCGYSGEFYCAERLSGDGYLGASDIRKAIFSGEYESVKEHVPENVRSIYSELLENVARPSKLFDLEFSLFRLGRTFEGTFDSECGIVHRLKKCADAAADGTEMFRTAATKKYTDARLRRAALFCALGITDADLREMPRFTVLLAASEKGRKLLKNVPTEDFTVVTKPSVDFSDPQYVRGTEADRLYTLCCDENLDSSFFIRESPVIF